MNKVPASAEQSLNNCINQFNRFFKIHLANTKTLKQAVYHIRYQVFCQEQQNRPNNQQLEIDHYDEYAQHLLIEHRRTGIYAGCARLVLPEVNQYSTSFPLCQLNQHEHHNLQPNHSTTAATDGLNGEMSKVVVLPHFRRTGQDTPITSLTSMPVTPVFSLEERQTFAHINLTLIVSMLILAQLNHLDGLFAFTEPRMCQHLQRIGLNLIQVSENLNYYGGKSLYYLPADKFTSDLNEELNALYHYFYPKLHSQFETDVSFPYAQLG